MKQAVVGMAVAGLLLGGASARAETALVEVTPQSIQGSTFRLTSKTVRNNAVEFVIHRDVRNIEGPGRSAYLSNSETDGKGLGTPVKLEEEGKTFTFRFTVPAAKLAGSEFTLWGQGARGEGVTYRFHLAQFRRP